MDGDGLLDFIIDGAVYSADLADLTLKSSDIIITDSGGNITSEIEEGPVSYTHLTLPTNREV